MQGIFYLIVLATSTNTSSNLDLTVFATLVIALVALAGLPVSIYAMREGRKQTKESKRLSDATERALKLQRSELELHRNEQKEKEGAARHMKRLEHYHTIRNVVLIRWLDLESKWARSYFEEAEGGEPIFVSAPHQLPIFLDYMSSQSIVDRWSARTLKHLSDPKYVEFQKAKKAADDFQAEYNGKVEELIDELGNEVEAMLKKFSSIPPIDKLEHPQRSDQYYRVEGVYYTILKGIEPSVQEEHIVETRTDRVLASIRDKDERERFRVEVASIIKKHLDAILDVSPYAAEVGIDEVYLPRLKECINDIIEEIDGPETFAGRCDVEDMLDEAESKTLIKDEEKW